MSILAIKQTNESPKHALNLLPIVANFNDNFTWNKVSGESSATITNTQGRVYAGNKSVEIAFTGTDEIVFNRGDSSMEVFIEKTGEYILSYRFFKSDPTANITFKVNVYVNGVLYPDNIIEQNLYSTNGFTDGVWNAYTQVLNLNDSDIIDFSFSVESDTTGHQLHFDGMSLLYNDRELSPLNVYREVEVISREIETTVTIDVPSISSNGYYVLTTPLIDAAIGDYIQMTYPAELITLGLTVGVPIVTNVNEVSCLIHNHTGGSVDPSSGEYKFKTIKYGDF